MLVLITGIGNVGKSTLRRRLVNGLRQREFLVQHVDTDGFSRERNPQDQDIVQLNETTLDTDTIYLIEDIHGLDHRPLRSIWEYHLVLYVTTGFWTHLLFWLGRGWQWFKRGIYDWQPHSGFRGTKQPWDLNNLPGILRVISEAFEQRKFIHTDLARLREDEISHRIIHARWSKNGPVFPRIPFDLFTNT